MKNIVRLLAGASLAMTTPGCDRASTHFERGEDISWRDKEESIVEYTEAIRLDPSHKAAYNARGFQYTELDEFENAIADFTEAIRLDPTYSQAYYNRGYVWLNTSELDKAIADYTEAIRLDPSHANAFNNRGTAFRRKGEFEKAIADYGEASRLKPRSGVNYMLLAWILATAPDSPVRDGTLAVKYATTACELTNWNDAACIETLAAAHAEAGDFEKAIEWQERAIELEFLESLESRPNYEARLRLYQEGRPFRLK